ncbi:MAG: 3-oxoacid CoA-transferase subunit A [Christensenellales bacterium]|uniref:CoA transferase subunit A n=1 Tax=Candidatus Avichristensenella intestinipullorum TaxID=2840693 RepID=A0A9D1CIZ3_9FIRM|nr:3-oxoacid CoA-transferase subunit A [Christensenellales bacterium]HIQ63217.1 CoA transferase subunit A [Candidatus Avichristensenella intestinipullorum]
MNKRTTVQEAVSHVKDGDVLMIGGFLQGGCPETLVKALVETQVKDLTIVSNDTGTVELNTIKLQQQGRVKKVYATYIGANPETGRMVIEKPASVELNPQGTLAERIRAAGAGIAAFLTPVGVKTIVERGRDTVMHNGREYLFEEALHGDVAFVRATIVDEHGNCFMRGTTKNFNAIMPAACKYVVVEAEKIVPAGELDPELVTVPGIFIDAIVEAEG